MPANERHIALFDLDAFFVSVERLENNHLIGKPVIIGGLSGRGVVASCSYEARQYGVHSAMPMRMARMLCKDAHVIRGDMEKYSRYSKIVTQVIAEKAPVYEKASVDEHYIDLTGMDRFFGSLQWTKELRKDIIRHTGLPISFGLSVNKTISKIAAGEAKPNGEIFIPCKQVRPFINPLSISKIPMIGQKTFQLLRSMGISKVATLSAMPPELIKNALGKNGIVIWKKANGIDTSPVEAYSEKKSISTEHTFQQDTADIALMNELVIKMAEKLAFQLRKQQKLTSCITVKIRYANFDTHTLQKKIAYTAFDHMIINTAKELFKKIYQRRMMIRLIGIRLSALAGGTQQLSLFEDTSEMANLYYTMDKIRKRFGNNAVGRAVGEKRQ